MIIYSMNIAPTLQNCYAIVTYKSTKCDKIFLSEKRIW